MLHSWTRIESQMIECYQLRYHFAESQKMACYLKRETYSGPICLGSGKWHLNWYHSIIWDATLVQQYWELELVTESQLGEVQMKLPKEKLLEIELNFDAKNISMNLINPVIRLPSLYLTSMSKSFPYSLRCWMLICSRAIFSLL